MRKESFTMVQVVRLWPLRSNEDYIRFYCEAMCAYFICVHHGSALNTANFNLVAANFVALRGKLTLAQCRRLDKSVSKDLDEIRKELDTK